jgi:hypothetical protein
MPGKVESNPCSSGRTLFYAHIWTKSPHPNAHSAYVLTNFSNLKMDALHSSERSGDLYTYVWLT